MPHRTPHRPSLPVLAAASAVLVLPAWLIAGTAEPAADTFIQAADIAGDAPSDAGSKPVLAIKSDKPAGKLDRLGVLRFEVPEDADFAGASLTLHLKVQGKSATSGDYELYGLLPGAGEDDLDEATYTAAVPDSAVDASGNRLKETFVHDADPDAKGVQPVATATLADGDEMLTFSGETLVAYLNDVADDDVVFVLRATPPAEKSGTPATFFHSREADEGLRPTLSWD